ncbi:Arginase family protein [Rubrimonas cliftonensis]|uniref:Arginase family protein n=1 Tax=Rubrimonas cliftonensis TaxID=89524 RepID=A0A1H3VIP6_9RHOB|nr:Arginase family protein [Rubrimonas cliftonensis]
MAHGYETGRLNLPFVGISTFGKSPYLPDWSAIDADVAILGAPFDFGAQWRAGARFGPRSIREASTLFSFGHAGACDHEDDVTYLDGVRMVDLGDADIVHTDTLTSHANIEAGVRAILKAGALPVVLGGDHSVSIPCMRAFAKAGPVLIVQIDAHLDFVDDRHGVRFGHGNPIRRAAEQAYLTGLTQRCIRNVSSTARGRLRGGAGDGLRHSVGAAGARARRGGHRRARAGGRALLRHYRHRRFRPLHRAGRRHAVPWRVSLLRRAGDPRSAGAAPRDRRDRPRGGRAGLRLQRLHRDPRRPDPAEPDRARHARAGGRFSGGERAGEA